jgi:ABC-2 type transport system ATP-binding protein
MSISLENVSKRYGRVHVLENISLSVEQSECFCLLGRNGAGKSTLINIMSDIIRPDSGRVTYDGLSFDQDELAIKRRLGVLPESDPTISELTGYQYLEFVSYLHDIPAVKAKAKVEHFFNLLLENEEIGYRRIATYSRGMRVKLALCAALLHSPVYLLLDEPFTGLDPVSASILVKLFQELRNSGAAIFISSHNLNYVEQIATSVGVLDQRQLKFTGTIKDLKDKHNGTIEQSLLDLLGASRMRPVLEADFSA